MPLADDTKRTYVSRVRMYLAWLAGVLASPGASRRFKGDPLTNPKARDWAVRDYRLYLLREADPKRSVRYSNNALAALDDLPGRPRRFRRVHRHRRRRKPRRRHRRHHRAPTSGGRRDQTPLGVSLRLVQPGTRD